LNPHDQPKRWWTPFSIASGQTAALRLGPLALRLHKTANEWWLHWEHREDEDTAWVEQSVSTGPFSAEDYDRFVCCEAEGTATLRPLLADRPVVVKPRQRVYVLPGEETTFFISTPVWIRVEVGNPVRVLTEIPTRRLSDTWFGPSTREGELCYAARTHARSSLRELPRRTYRAITPVNIKNSTDNQLSIDKLSLPVPLLSLYGTADGDLWTERVTLIRATPGEMASLRIVAGAPSDAASAQLLTGPRGQPEKAGLVRAFSGLFG
jgi:hypothetical protein